MKVFIPYSPRHIQGYIHEQLEAHRWAVLVIHRRYGKTVMLVNHIIKMALCNKRQSPPPKYIYMAPYIKQAKRLTWDYFKFYCAGLPGVKFNESDLRVDLPTGAQIYLCGADNAESHRGLYVDGCVLDEYEDIDASVFTSIIRPGLGDYGGWCVFSGTLKGKTKLWKTFQYAEQNRDKNWFCLCLKASETGVIPKEELDDAKRIMSEDEYDREYECNPNIIIGKKIYPEFNRAIHVAKESLLPTTPQIIYRGWDNTGLSPAIVLTYITNTGQWCIFKEFCFSDTGIMDATESMILWCNQKLPYGCTFVDYADPAGKNRDSIKMSPRDYIMRKAMEMGSEIILRDGIQTWKIRRESVAGRLVKIINGEPAMIIDPGCETTISGFEGAYAYQEVAGLPGQFIEKAVKNDCSHIHDAIQYPATRLFLSRDDFNRIVSSNGGVGGYDEYEVPYNSYIGRSSLGGY